MNYDRILVDIFFIEDKLDKKKIIKYNLNKKKHYLNIQKYLMSRFIDTKSERETLYRLKYNINETPLCPICGSKLKFNGRNNQIFLSHCSNKCKKLDSKVNDKWKKSCKEKGTNRKKAQETCLKKYNVVNPFQIPEIIQKIKEINKYKLNISLLKREKTCLEKYGEKSYLQTQEFKDQSKNTCLIKYGVTHPMKSDKIKDKYDWKTISKKINMTKEKNDTFNKSNSEEESYLLLKEKFQDIIRQYKSEKYPFLVDFYIPSLDLYIECNYHWTHGKHAFDCNNIEDQNILNKWKQKPTKFYINAINTWTIRDVKKRNIAKQNKLNYIEFWNIDELKKWLYN